MEAKKWSPGGENSQERGGSGVEKGGREGRSPRARGPGRAGRGAGGEVLAGALGVAPAPARRPPREPAETRRPARDTLPGGT